LQLCVNQTIGSRALRVREDHLSQKAKTTESHTAMGPKSVAMILQEERKGPVMRSASLAEVSTPPAISRMATGRAERNRTQETRVLNHLPGRAKPAVTVLTISRAGFPAGRLKKSPMVIGPAREPVMEMIVRGEEKELVMKNQKEALMIAASANRLEVPAATAIQGPTIAKAGHPLMINPAKRAELLAAAMSDRPREAKKHPATSRLAHLEKKKALIAQKNREEAQVTLRSASLQERERTRRKAPGV
jgi:hypothetical protein